MIDMGLYVRNTVRPDFTYAAKYFAFVAHSPTQGMCKRAKHAVRYLDGPVDLGL